MYSKTYLGKIVVRIGETENTVVVLIVANSDDAAYDRLDRYAAMYYGEGDEESEDGGYYANGGEIFTSPLSCEEIGLATFLELRRCLPVRSDDNVTTPTDADLESLDSLKTAAQALTRGLRAQSLECPQSKVLHALASSWGEKNWHVLKSKVADEAKAAVLQAANEVVSFSDSAGCDEGLTVTSSHAVEALSDALQLMAKGKAPRESVIDFLVKTAQVLSQARGQSIADVDDARDLLDECTDEQPAEDASPAEIEEAVRRLLK